MSEDKRGILARKLRGRMADPIAIISAACRAPGARTPEELWTLVRDGRDMVSEVPMDRWDSDSFFDPRPGTPGKMITRWAGVVEGVDGFDAGFFGISRPEAMQLDPQQRVVLEVAWETIARAGLDPATLAGSTTGVFLGIMNGDYFLSTYTGPKSLDMYAATGTSHNIAAGRVSYFFDFHGPCESVDTACSSSLVALHRACVALRGGECDLALAGGVNIIVDPWLNVCLSAMGAISPTGRCRAFDAGADGMVRGDGCGLLLLKRLADAERDGDRVLAVVAASTVNHNGRAQGLTAPNGIAHRSLIKQAMANAGVRPEQVDYVETHGTGTRLGDPIELGALAEVLDVPERAAARTPVGSVKTNFGHTESAAGVISVIKVIKAIEHGEIPPQLHLTEVNPHIALEDTPLSIAADRRPWVARDGVRRAGVSAFGLSGTNAHVIIEERRGDGASQRQPQAQLALVFSARSVEALSALSSSYATYLDERPTTAAVDFCAAVSSSASGFTERLALFAESRVELMARLREVARGELANVTRHSEPADEEPPSLEVSFRGSAPAAGKLARLGVAVIDEALAGRPAFAEADDGFVHASIEQPRPDKLVLVVGDATSGLPRQHVVRLAAALQLRGIRCDWERVLGGSRLAALPLPSYPFQRTRFWASISPTRGGFEAANAAPVADPSSVADRVRSAGDSERQDLLRGCVESELVAALGSDVAANLTHDKNLVDAGLSSVLAMSVRNRLQSTLRLTLPLTLVFEHPTVDALVSHLAEAVADQQR